MSVIMGPWNSKNTKNLKKIHKIACGELLVKICIFLRSYKYFGLTEIKLVFSALRPAFSRLIPHTAKTSFENQMNFFTWRKILFFINLQVRSRDPCLESVRTKVNYSFYFRDAFLSTMFGNSN